MRLDFPIVCDDEKALPPTGDAVTVEVRKDDARLELTEPLREIVDDEGSVGRMFIAGMLHAEVPNWVGASVGGGIAVEGVAHRLVKVASTVFCGSQEYRQLASGGTGGKEIGQL